jgi:scyllo-inositol 2-dehydrogenase (NADP+)
MAPRVGIAGYGLAGRYFHAPLLVGAGFEITSILTTNQQRISDARADFPNSQICNSIEELLKTKIDLLVVASANQSHAEQAIAGLKAGIPVVVDKPMGRTLKETEEIIAVAKQTGVGVSTYFNRKWDSDSLTIKKIIGEGVLGKIFRLESRFEVFRPQLKGGWREKRDIEQGGGNLLDLQPHLISTALDWFGPAQLISASVRTIRGGSDDDIVLTLKHQGGVDSYLSASAIMGSPGPRIRLVGDKATLVIKDLDPQENLLRSGLKPKDGKWGQSTKSAAYIHVGDQVTEYQAVDGNYTQYYLEVKNALAGGKWPVSIEEALAVAKIIDQAREISFRSE